MTVAFNQDTYVVVRDLVQKDLDISMRIVMDETITRGWKLGIPKGSIDFAIGIRALQRGDVPGWFPWMTYI